MAINSSIAEKYLAQADSAIASMTGAGSAVASGAASAAAAAADKAARAADTTAGKIGETVSTMQGIAGGLLPQADKISGDASTVRNIAGGNLAYSADWLKQAEGLRNMDENAGGISGEFAKLYKQLDPALQMSLAASDARKQSQAQTESAVRALQRAGCPPRRRRSPRSGSGCGKHGGSCGGGEDKLGSRASPCRWRRWRKAFPSPSRRRVSESNSPTRRPRDIRAPPSSNSFLAASRQVRLRFTAPPPLCWRTPRILCRRRQPGRFRQATCR